MARLDDVRDLLFAPGSDLVARALVSGPFEVDWSSGDQHLQYRQDPSGVRGTWNGQPFQLQMQGQRLLGETPAGSVDERVQEQPFGTQVAGRAGEVHFEQSLTRERAGDRVARVAGKFG